MNCLARRAAPIARRTARALELASRVDGLRWRGDRLESIFDALPFAVIALERDGAIAEANFAARALRLSVHGVEVARHLRFGDEQARKRFGDLLARPERREARGMVLEPAEGRVMTIDLFDMPPGFGMPGRWMLVIREASEIAIADAERFADLHRLTPGETRIALWIARGIGVEASARKLGLSPVTVRVHLQHIYDKADLHSQAALASAIAAMRHLAPPA